MTALSCFKSYDVRGQLGVNLDAGILAAHRERFPAWMDADAFTLSDA